MFETIKGLGVSDGVGIGELLLVKPDEPALESKSSNVELESNRLQQALGQSLSELEDIYESKRETLGEDKAQIFQAHIMILQDPEWVKDIAGKITDDSWSAEYAVQLSAEAMAQMFEGMDNPYFQERAHDIRDVARRIIRILRGEASVDLGLAKPGSIIAAVDLTPSDTAQLNAKNIVGIITAVGGKTSHSAIIARTLGIPAVMGIGRTAFEALAQEQKAIVDGDQGTLTLNPTEQVIVDYKDRINQIELEKKELQKYIGLETKTADGKSIELAANIASPNDLERVLENDAEGIGLFRSEFLFMDRTSAPTEEEQYESYSAVLKGMTDKPVIIRTMDIGGDKEVSYLNMPEEMNPFLGYRAIRYCLNEPEVFKIQIRALLRAGVYGKLRIMLPMISSVQEVRQSKAIIESVKEDLRNENVEFADDVPVGIMIEIPAAAIASDLLAKEVDFFSIGTNDLIQYTVAVDRMNESIADLYTAYHPAVLRLIKMTIKNGHEAGIWVGMCGSVAGDLTLMPLLIGMGLDEFSMSPSTILKARKTTMGIDYKKAQSMVNDILSLSTATDIENALSK